MITTRVINQKCELTEHRYTQTKKEEQMYQSVTSSLRDASPNSTVRTRWPKLRLQIVSRTFFSTGATWTSISVLLSPPAKSHHATVIIYTHRKIKKAGTNMLRPTYILLLYLWLAMVTYVSFFFMCQDFRFWKYNRDI